MDRLIGTTLCVLAAAGIVVVAATAATRAPTGAYTTTIAGRKPAALNGRWVLSFLAGGTGSC